MTLLLCIPTVCRNKLVTYLGTWRVPHARVILCLHAWAYSRQELLTVTIFATGFFYDNLKISSAQDVSSALNTWSRESLSVPHG